VIKIVAIHKLFEVALDALFNALSDNFLHNKTLMVGTRYNSIRIIRSSINGLEHYEQYTDCTITHVYNGKYAGSPVTLFNFATNDGDLIMGCTLFDTIII